jgi:hypothetical protein
MRDSRAASAAPATLAGAGLALVGTMTALALTQPTLGSPPFLALVSMASAGYLTALAAARRTVVWSRATVWIVLLAAAMRLPLCFTPINPSNDMTRYVWDARVQRTGINPFEIRPNDPRVAALHTADTLAMSSFDLATPYPPVAQHFFRVATAMHDSATSMRLALLVCDGLTILVVWRWLAASGSSPVLLVGYAWHPLVLVEVAFSGHIDVLGALLMATAALGLRRRHRAGAALGVAAAVGVKYLAVVTAPLLWRRVGLRDAILGLLLVFAAAAPFLTWSWTPAAGLAMFVQKVRFNGPIFGELAHATSPWIAAACAVAVGLAVAAWLRRRNAAEDALAWPMAASLVMAPVVYPWYLLWLTPFVTAPRNAPILAWTLVVPVVYVVWHVPAYRALWRVPGWALGFEYGVVAASAAGLLWCARHRSPAARPCGA